MSDDLFIKRVPSGRHVRSHHPEVDTNYSRFREHKVQNHQRDPGPEVARELRSMSSPDVCRHGVLGEIGAGTSPSFNDFGSESEEPPLSQSIDVEKTKAVLLALTRHIRGKGGIPSPRREQTDDMSVLSESIHSLLVSDPTAASTISSLDHQGASIVLSDDNKIAMIKLARNIAAAKNKTKRNRKEKSHSPEIVIGSKIGEKQVIKSPSLPVSYAPKTHWTQRGDRTKSSGKKFHESGVRKPVTTKTGNRHHKPAEDALERKAEVCSSKLESRTHFCIPSGFSTDDMQEQDKMALVSFYFGKNFGSSSHETEGDPENLYSESQNESEEENSPSSFGSMMRNAKENQKRLKEVMSSGKGHNHHLSAKCPPKINHRTGARATTQHNTGTSGFRSCGGRQGNGQGGVKDESSPTNRAHRKSALKRKQNRRFTSTNKPTKSYAQEYSEEKSESASNPNRSSSTTMQQSQIQKDDARSRKPPIMNRGVKTTCDISRNRGSISQTSDAKTIDRKVRSRSLRPERQNEAFESHKDNKESLFTSPGVTESEGGLVLCTDENDVGHDNHIFVHKWDCQESPARKEIRNRPIKHKRSRHRGSSTDSLESEEGQQEGEEPEDTSPEKVAHEGDVARTCTRLGTNQENETAYPWSKWTKDTVGSGAETCQGLGACCFRMCSPTSKFKDKKRADLDIIGPKPDFKPRLNLLSDFRNPTSREPVGGFTPKIDNKKYGYESRYSFNNQLDNGFFSKWRGDVRPSTNRLSPKYDLVPNVGDIEMPLRDRNFVQDFRRTKTRQLASSGSRPFLFSKFRDKHSFGTVPRLSIKTMESPARDYFRRRRGPTHPTPLTGRRFHLSDRDGPMSPEKPVFDLSTASYSEPVCRIPTFRRTPLRSDITHCKRSATTLRCMSDSLDEWPRSRLPYSFSPKSGRQLQISLGTQSSMTDVASCSRLTNTPMSQITPAVMLKVQASELTKYFQSVWPDLRRPLTTFVIFLVVCWLFMMAKVPD